MFENSQEKEIKRTGNITSQLERKEQDLLRKMSGENGKKQNEVETEGKIINKIGSHIQRWFSSTQLELTAILEAFLISLSNIVECAKTKKLLVTWHKVKAYTGVPENELANKIAKEALEIKKLTSYRSSSTRNTLLRAK
ncbi:38610_t:CDS:2 [Gigaspora margarita]|uniref:38610_t:CDS:1 n=1 Tax=Gigaspora margarita TaxID=4874 RepID=A0ABN7UET1_GIGMA|nr:38610_t:CDS:2 [Gigaspora margarita]